MAWLCQRALAHPRTPLCGFGGSPRPLNSVSRFQRPKNNSSICMSGLPSARARSLAARSVSFALPASVEWSDPPRLDPNKTLTGAALLGVACSAAMGRRSACQKFGGELTVPEGAPTPPKTTPTRQLPPPGTDLGRRETPQPAPINRCPSVPPPSGLLSGHVVLYSCGLSGSKF
jgi:hypothetical protein